jgi:TolB-like protein
VLIAIILLGFPGALIFAWAMSAPSTAPAQIGAAAPVGEKSIAVLPFENLSEDATNAFFTDGVHDEILTNLPRIADLKVISRTSVMQYKMGTKRNLREIADELGVAHIVEAACNVRETACG